MAPSHSIFTLSASHQHRGDYKRVSLQQLHYGHASLYCFFYNLTEFISFSSKVFREKLNELGLEVMDRRTNRHGRGLNAEVQTDLYVRDKTNSVTLQKIAGQRRIKRALLAAMDLSEEEAKIFATAAKEVQRCMKDGEMFFDAFDKNNVSL